MSSQKTIPTIYTQSKLGSVNLGVVRLPKNQPTQNPLKNNEAHLALINKSKELMTMGTPSMDGAQVLVSCLEKLGVEYIFGYSGGAAIPIFDALKTVGGNIKFILSRHEQGAAHMADGYARASGKPGVVLVTSGPGAGNVVTGLMTAHMDSVPIIVLSGQQIRPMLGFDAFQEADIFSITMPVVKHNYLVMNTNDIPKIVNEAFDIATSGRPGPVLIDLPKDVTSGKYSGANYGDIKPTGFYEKPKLAENYIKVVADKINTSKKPIILAGHGVLISGACNELAELSTKQNIPVVTTLLGKGAIDETSELSLGMLGMHGTAAANKAIVNADLILNIGSRFDDRIVGQPDKFGKNAYIIHVDIDDSELGKIIKPSIAINADAKEFLTSLNKHVKPDKRTPWVREIDSLKQQFEPITYSGTTLTQQAVLKEISRQSNGQAIITTDVGQHQMWAAQYIKVKDNHAWISSGGAGTMGFGMPAAIGAQVANPEKKVIAIVGDGGFQMTLCELATAAVNKIPIKIFIMNNHYLGMVRQWQELFYDNRESGVNLEGNPNFVKLAESYGIKAINVTDTEEMPKQIAEAINYNDGPIVINCEVAKTDNVYPMVPPGKALEDMIIEAPTIKLAKPTGST